MKYLLVLVVVVVGIWMLASRFRKPRDPGPGRSTGAAPGGSPQAAPSEGAGADKAAPGEMVACRHCGVHLPADEAFLGPVSAEQTLARCCRNLVSQCEAQGDDRASRLYLGFVHALEQLDERA